MKKGVQSALFALIAIFIFLMPLLTLFNLAFEDASVNNLEHFKVIFASERTWAAIKNTLILGALSTLLSFIWGGFFAVIIAYTNIRLKKLIEILILLPHLIPGYIIALSWTSLFSANGTVNNFLNTCFGFKVNMYSMGGIVFMLGISNAALVYLILVDVLRKIPRDQEYASHIASYSITRTLLQINFKSIKVPLISSMVLAFLSAIDNFAIPISLGSSSGVTVLSTFIYEKAIGFGPSSFNQAAVLSLLLSSISLLVVVWQWFLTRKSQNLTMDKVSFEERVVLQPKLKRIVEFFVVVGLLILNLVPILYMFFASLYTGYVRNIFEFSKMNLENYALVFSSPSLYSGFITSFILSIIAIFICAVLGVWSMHFKNRTNSKSVHLLEMTASLTYSVPGIVLALSMIFYWSQIPNVYGTMTILLLAYVTRYALLLLKGSQSAFITLSKDLEEASDISGANVFRKWVKIIIPLIKQQIFSSSFLMFVGAFTELTLSSLLSSANSKTVGLTIFGLQSSGDNAVAQAYSILITLFILCLLSVRALWEKKERQTQ